MEYKTEGIVLRTTDYKENDKLLTVLTPERGKLTAGIRGVRKSGSKLNFAAQPFAFCEYVFAERGGRYTVTGAYLHDGFFELRSDILRFYAACTLAEIADGILAEREESEAVFIALAEGLKELAHTNGDAADVLLSFLVTVLHEAGYMLDLDGCGVCGGEIGEIVYFDFDAGFFVCDECGGRVRASRSTYETLQKAAGLSYDEGKCKGGKKRALRLLKTYLAEKTEGEFPCFSELIRLYEEN